MAQTTSVSPAAAKPNPYLKAVTASNPPRSRKAPATGKRPPSAAPSRAHQAGKTGPRGDAVAPSPAEVLRTEVLALGGDEAELKMLLDVDSDSELEDEAPAAGAGKAKGKGKQSSQVDPQLSKDLQSLFKSLDFSSASAANPPVDGEDSLSEAADDSESSESGSEEESESEDEDEDGDEESRDPKANAVEEPKAKQPPTDTKKETKFEREERRRLEREAVKEQEKAAKALAREARVAVKMPSVKSPWIVDPTPQWYAVPLAPLPTSVTRPVASVVASLHAKGTALLEKDNALYSSSLAPRSTSSAPPPPNGLSKSDQVFIQQILTSGTSSDKVSALLLLVSSSPLHTMTYLDQLGSLAKKKSREESGRAVRGLVDWWRGEGGGAPTRKLRAFGDQPGLAAAATALESLDGKNRNSTTLSRPELERTLAIWAFEDWLKKWFFEVLKALEGMSVDPLPHPRTLAVVHLSNILRDKPEQEGNILRLLVNKLGDSQRSIASKTSHHLLQILQYHPGMTPILVREVSSLVLRPSLGVSTSHVRFGKDAQKAVPKDNGQDHARYYGVITLNQVMLSKSQTDVAGKLIEVYFQIFGDILGRVTDDGEAPQPEKQAGEKRKRGGDGGLKKGKKLGQGESEPGEVSETDSKLVAAVLTGVNRAFPFAKIDDEAFKARLDTLFRITHTGTFNVSIQALMLIFHVSAAKRAVSDRFYRALYASLFDSRLAGSSKQALYLNLILKAMKQDPNAQRVTALLKRLVQVMLGMEVTFILGSIWIVGELIATIPGLRKILTEPESLDRSVVATAASTSSSHSTAEAALHPNDGRSYDGKKREPQFANAQNSCLWEIVPLLNHYHPSVAVAAERLLHGEPVTASSDLEQHSLNHFLDRFVYREVKKVASTKGSSMMQSGVSGQDRSGRIVMKKGPARGEEALINSEGFKNKHVDDVPVDQLFFHTYFAGKVVASEKRSKASHKRKSKRSKEDGSSDEESIADLGFSDKEDAEAGPAMDDRGEDDEDEDDAEEEIWKAMKASMPKAGGDSDLGEPDEDDDDESDLGEFDYADSDDEPTDGASKPFQSAFANEDEFDDLEDDDNLVEDEDDLIGSDEDVPLFGDESEVEMGTGGGKSSKAEDRKAKKRKLKHLPTFATADDYAHLLGASDDEGDE